MPTLESAPEFYVLDSASVVRQRVGVLDVTYIADRPDEVIRLNLQRVHAQALQYLLHVVRIPTSIPRSKRKLMVVWVGVSPTKGSVGGASGARSFLANYPLTDSTSSGSGAAFATVTISHEQFHQLCGMINSHLPVWLGESLAHYYGLKALARSERSSGTDSVRARFIDLARPVDQGLLELQRRNAAGDGSVYGQFYTQGATFWAALDAAISVATGGRRTLDDYISRLLRSNAPADASLPQSFARDMRRVIGTQFDSLVSKYVGT